MVKILDRISELWSQWFEGLNARERRFLGMASVIFCVFMSVLTFYIAASKINTKRSLLKINSDQLLEIRELESEYVIAKQKSEKTINNIKRNNVSLTTFIQGIVSRLGLSVKDFNETRAPVGKSGVIEISVKINLSKLSIDKMTALLEAIESDDNYGDNVKITKLKINNRFDEKDLLDIQMTVSTWKSA